MADGIPDLNVFTDKRNRQRVTWPGRKGFPIMLRNGETPEDGYLRTIATDAAKAAAAADAAAGGGDQGAPSGAAPPPTSAPRKRFGRKSKGTGDPAPPQQSAGSADSEQRARPPGSDPKPRGGRPFGRPRSTTKELEDVLAELLVLPAIPMGMPVRDPLKDQVVMDGSPGGTLVPGFRPRCEFCRDHFLQAGPQTAHEIAVLSEGSEPLRRFLERIHAAWKNVGVVSIVAGYAAKPVLHHLAPEPMLAGMGPVLGVPPRPPKPPVHTHDEAEFDAAAPDAAAPAAGPGGPTFGSPVPGSSPAGV